jgi:DNA helicase IV
MSEWKEIMETAKEETRKELTEEIRDLSILSDGEIEVIAPTDLDKSYLRDLLNVMKNHVMTNEKKLEYITSSSGSCLIINLMQRVLS